MVLGAVILGVSLCRADTIAVNNPSVYWNRGGVKVNGGTSATIVNCGNGCKFGFNKTALAVTVDVSALVSAGYGNETYPTIATTIDGVRTVTQLSSSSTSVVVGSGLANTTHVFELVLIGVDQSGNTNRWAPIMALVISGFTVDSGAVATSPTLRNGGFIWVFGDSIPEGAEDLAKANFPPYYSTVGDASKSYVSPLAAGLNMEATWIAFSGQQLGGTTGNISNVPSLMLSYDLLYSGQARDWSVPPNIIVMAEGTNNGNSSATAANCEAQMENFRAKAPYTLIVVFVPLGQYQPATGNLVTGFGNYQTDHPSDFRVQLVNGGSTWADIVTNNSYSIPHPNVAGHSLIGAAMGPIILSPLKPGSPRTSAVGF